MEKFSEVSLDSLGIGYKERLMSKNEILATIVEEFKNDLNDENKNNLKFIKFVISIIKDKNINLPVLPQITNKILELSNDKNSTFNDYANVIRSDSSITLKVIKLANAPMYRATKNISDIELAMSRIGVDGLKEVVLVDSLKSIVFKNIEYTKYIEKIWKDSLLTALIASRLAKFFNTNSSFINSHFPFCYLSSHWFFKFFSL